MSAPVAIRRYPLPVVESIPEELRRLDQWVCWRLEPGPEGRPAKIPKNAVTGGNASSTDPTTWTSFTRACEALAEGGFSGIGFVLSASNPYTFIDLDHCRDPQTGAIDAWAQDDHRPL